MLKREKTKPTPRDILAEIPELPENAYTFMQLFKRFEYAVKASSFAENGPSGVYADWPRYVRERLDSAFTNHFLETTGHSTTGGLAYGLASASPPEAGMAGDQLVYKNRRMPTDDLELVRAVCYLYDNLLHECFEPVEWSLREFESELNINIAIDILCYILDVDERLREVFLARVPD